MEKTTKWALGLGAAAGVAAFVFWPAKSKADDSSGGKTTGTGNADFDKAMEEAGKQGCMDGAADKAAGKEPKVKTDIGTVPSTVGEAYGVAYRACYAAGTTTSTGTASKSTLAGQADGCTTGTADAKKGNPRGGSLTNPAIAAESLKYDNPKEYMSAFTESYYKCFDKSAPTTGGGTVGTVVFDPAQVSARGGDPVRAHNLAVAIAHSPPIGKEPGCDDAEAIGGKSYCSLADFASYPPNVAGLVALQQASGITPDGRYGTQTQRAFDYFLSNSA